MERKLTTLEKIGVLSCHIAWRGFVIWTLYGWLVLPILPDAPNLTFVEVTAIYFFISCLKGMPIADAESDERQTWKAVITLAVAQLPLLGTGALLSLFV